MQFPFHSIAPKAIDLYSFFSNFVFDLFMGPGISSKLQDSEIQVLFFSQSGMGWPGNFYFLFVLSFFGIILYWVSIKTHYLFFFDLWRVGS